MGLAMNEVERQRELLAEKKRIENIRRKAYQIKQKQKNKQKGSK